jgi:hypothetical protein
MRRYLPLPFLLLLAAAPATRPGNTIVDHARKILESIRTSSYSHKTDIDESAGRYVCDCSEFVVHVLRKCAPETLAAIQRTSEHKRPLAVDFHAAFMAAPAEHGSLRRIRKLADARMGDMIAWRVAEIVKGESTGHVMIVDEPPVADGQDVYRLVVIDSTSLPHANDTRKDGASGVGRGTIWVRVNADDEPAEVSPRKKSGPFKPHTMAIGRAE